MTQKITSFLDVQTTRITTYMFDGSKWDPKEEFSTDQMALSGSGSVFQDSRRDL